MSQQMSVSERAIQRVAEFNRTGRFHVDADDVLTGAYHADLSRVLVIGVTASGDFYVAGSDDTAAHINDVRKFLSDRDG